MNKKILEAIRDAEMVLVGIGEEFSPKLPDTEVPDILKQYKASQYYSDLNASAQLYASAQSHEVRRNPVFQAYDALREAIGGRPYFVVTMNTDDLIWHSGFEQDRIVAPCGSLEKMQCDTHIVDSVAIRDAVLAGVENREDPQRMIEQYAVCPECGKPLSFHTIAAPNYLEKGYLDQWKAYKTWLTTTLNRRLCVLELGVGFAFPQVIRWPFEKVAFYNQKSVFVRVNSQLPQVAEELEGRSVSLKESPITAMLAPK